MRAFYIPIVIVVLTGCGAKPESTELPDGGEPEQVDWSQGGGLLYKLPKDGTWATYQIDASAQVGNEQTRLKGTMRMASVGQVTEGGQACRWIETISETEVQDGDKIKMDQKLYFKVLVPEKFLVKGEMPMDHAIRAWERRGEKEGPQKMMDPKYLKQTPLEMILAGPLKDAKTLPKAEVESKLGKLQCKGVAGSLDGGPSTFKVRYTIENRLHPDAPFGVVSSRWTGPILKGDKPVTRTEDGKSEEGTGTAKVIEKMEMNLKLIDFGDNATSEMPDAK